MAKNVGYKCAALIAEIAGQDYDLRITSLKICYEKIKTFKMNESGILDVFFDQVIQKLKSPYSALEGKKMFYYEFPALIDVLDLFMLLKIVLIMIFHVLFDGEISNKAFSFIFSKDLFWYSVILSFKYY